ncbi:hypothetical protein LJC42_08305 [Eubacteriales bacterium OttesenSCG-928-K08]|nr:hypothetical protein [Eubacteriales bacterium OttesenSCG-928-K08]
MKKLLAIILSLLVMLTFGCSKTPPANTAKPATATELETPPATLEEIGESRIFLNGEHFPLPCTLEDLGRGYSIETRSVEYGNGPYEYQCVAGLAYNDKAIATVYLKDYEEGCNLKKVQICGIGYTITNFLDTDAPQWEIDGIQIRDPIEKALERYDEIGWKKSYWDYEESGYDYNYEAEKQLIGFSVCPGLQKINVDLGDDCIASIAYYNYK